MPEPARLGLVGGPTPADEAARRCEDQLGALEWGAPGPIGLWGAAGIAYSQLGQESRARELGTLAVDAARDAGVRFELAIARGWLALAVDAFDPDEAETQLRRSEDILSVYGPDSSDLASIRAELVRHAVRRNALGEANDLLAAARQGMRGDLVRELVAVYHAAALLDERRGDKPCAVHNARQAVAFARKADDINELAGVLETLGRLEPGSGALEEAASLFEQKGNLVALARLHARDQPRR